MIWAVHREKGAIVWAGQYPQEGYAVEELDDVIDTELQAFLLPSPAAVLAAKIAAGIAITSTGAAALNATYALDDKSVGQIFQIGMWANQFGAFPEGSTQDYPDITGVNHTFTVAQFVAFMKAVAPLYASLQRQYATLAAGGSPSWPKQSATIT